MNSNQTELIWMLTARKLANEATPEDLNTLQILLLQNPGENYAMEIMHDLWNSQPQHNKQYAENQYKQLLLKIQQSGNDEDNFQAGDIAISSDTYNGKKNKPWIYGSLSIFILALAAVFYFNQTGKSKDSSVALLPQNQNEIKTNYGSRTNIVLPDGSKVWLNAGSKLTYPGNFLGDTREVSLEGEAYFEVESNKKKPFIIHAKAMDIKVVGTILNVKSYPAETISEASLIKGSIEVTLKSRKNEKIMLKPNEKISVSVIPPAKIIQSVNILKATDTKPIVSIEKIAMDKSDNSINEIAWTSNKLIFNNQDFEELAETLERWYGKKITIQNEQLKTVKFTGKFYNENISQVLKALQLTCNFNYRHNQNLITIY